MDKFDICIIGAGVIGLAVARALSNSNINRSIVVLEKEPSFGQHTSSRNSEVIHAGLYYQPGSLKAQFCVRGKNLLYEHCDKYHIPYKRIGKYVVAQADQTEALEQLSGNAAASGITDLIWTSAAQLQDAEPAIRASNALFSPSTGIIDSHSFMQSLLHLGQNQGVEFAPFTTVETIEWSESAFCITSSLSDNSNNERYQFQAGVLINCAGLYATAIANTIVGPRPFPVPKIHYCKGDYFSYAARSPIRHLVYPLPDKNSAGLGIHATLDMSGQLRFGPDAEFIDTIHYAIDPGKAASFARAISSYFPSITPDKLIPAYAGIRPRLAPAGSLAQDFLIEDGKEHAMPGLIQLFGIESPGLTASLAIGEYVRDMVVKA